MKQSRSSPAPEVAHKGAKPNDKVLEFEKWRRKVGTLAMEGDQDARRALWRAFSSLAWPLGKLCKEDPSSVDFDLLQGVLQHCKYMLNRGIDGGNHNALTVAYVLAVELCALISQPKKEGPRIVAQLKTRVSDWPTLKTTEQGRSTELAHMVFERITFYRQLLTRHQRKIVFRDPLSRLTEINIRIAEANEFREVLRLPKKFDGDSQGAWWKTGKKILKRYWENHPNERDRDYKTLGLQPPGKKTIQTYAISKVQKSFVTIARSRK